MTWERQWKGDRSKTLRLQPSAPPWLVVYICKGERACGRRKARPSWMSRASVYSAERSCYFPLVGDELRPSCLYATLFFLLLRSFLHTKTTTTTTLFSSFPCRVKERERGATNIVYWSSCGTVLCVRKHRSKGVAAAHKSEASARFHHHSSRLSFFCCCITLRSSSIPILIFSSFYRTKSNDIGGEPSTSSIHADSIASSFFFVDFIPDQTERDGKA